MQKNKVLESRKIVITGIFILVGLIFIARLFFVQVIDDSTGKTLVSASTIDGEVVPQVNGKSKVEAARIVGQVIAERSKNAGIEAVVFDRGGYKYHGRVAALAEGAREGGLKF